MRKFWLPQATGALLALLLSACATAPPDQGVQDAPSSGGAPRLTATPLSPPESARTGMDITLAPKAPTILPGTGNFIDRKAATRPAPVPAPRTTPGEVTLNFDGADIRDVAKVIFDTLKENYTVDPQVQGQVTVQTSQPLARNQLLPTLETMLRMNQAVLVREGGLYKILPAAGAVRQGGLGPRLGGGGGVGYGVRIVPLSYVSAVEMQSIIAPFLPEGGVLRADVARNLLILAGTPQELANVQGTIDTFDVNWLKGMSIGMFRLRNVDSQAMATNLTQLLGEGSGTPVAGLLRFVPLSKLNAVLVITPQVEYLKEVATWIERLDGVGGERLYVYAVQNSQAEYVAELLNGLFNLGGGGASRGGDVAPGLKSGQLSSGGAESSGLSGGSGSSSLSGSSSSGSSSGLGASSASGASGIGGSTPSIGGRSGARAGKPSSGGGSMGSGGPSAGMEEVRIVADTENNSLLIWATSQNYERIVSTLQKMDVPPRQVLIEATIAEVTLTGKLQYGVQWFFNNDVGTNNGEDYTGTGSLGINADNLRINNVLSWPNGRRVFLRDHEQRRAGARPAEHLGQRFQVEGAVLAARDGGGQPAGGDSGRHPAADSERHDHHNGWRDHLGWRGIQRYRRIFGGVATDQRRRHGEHGDQAGSSRRRAAGGRQRSGWSGPEKPRVPAAQRDQQGHGQEWPDPGAGRFDPR